MSGTMGHPQSGNPCFGAAIPCRDICQIPWLWFIFLPESSGLVTPEAGLTPGTVTLAVTLCLNLQQSR